MSHPFVIPIQFHYHAAAITLNNTGISLIERQCYKQAMEVFKDGVTLMKVVSSLMTENSQQEDQQPGDQEVKILQREQQALVSWPNAQEMLRQGSHSLFHPQPDVGSMSSSSSSSPGAINAMLKVVTLDEIAANVQQALLRWQQTQDQESSLSSASERKVPSPLFLIRIESSALGAGTTTSFSGSLAATPSINTSSHLFDVDSSILLYNFGVAFEFMASCSATTVAATTTTTTTTSTPTSWIFEERHKSALSLFELSFNIFHDNFWVRHEQLANNSSPHHHQQDREATHHRADYLPLLILFLLNLVQQLSPTCSSSGGVLGPGGRDESTATPSTAATATTAAAAVAAAADRQEAFRVNLIQASEMFLQQQSYLAECMTTTQRGTAPAA